MAVIYLLRKKNGDRTNYRGDARKLLVYTSEAKAWGAVKRRNLKPELFEVVAYVPKEEN